MFGFAQVLAAVVLSSISTAIKYVAASEKADDLKELVKQRKQLETTRANLISADLKMKRNRSLRKATALANTNRALRGQDTEGGRAKIGNQGFISSKEGADTFAAETSGISARLRDVGSEMAEVAGRGQGLVSQLATGALGGIATAAAQGDISIFSKEEGELD